MAQIVRAFISTREPCAHSFYEDLESERDLSSIKNIPNKTGFNPKVVTIKGTQQNSFVGIISSVAVTGVTDQDFSILMKSSHFLKMLDNGIYQVRDGVYVEVDATTNHEKKESEKLGGGEEASNAELKIEDIVQTVDNVNLESQSQEKPLISIDQQSTFANNNSGALSYDDEQKIQGQIEKINEVEEQIKNETKGRGRPKKS